MTYIPPLPDQVIASNSSTATLVALAVTGASYSGSSLVLTGAWSSGGANAYVGQYFYVAGFTGLGVGNNSTYDGFVCTASSAGSITLTVTGGYNGFTGTPVASQMFIGTPVDCTASPISAVTLFTISDQGSVNFGSQIQWSQDNVNWVDHVQAALQTAGESCIISDKVRARYFRCVFIPLATLSYLRMQCVVSNTNTSGTVRDLDTAVWGDDEAQLVRAVITGKPVTASSPFPSSQPYIPVATDFYGNLQASIGGGAADAFGRLRVAEPVSLFNATFEYDTQPLLFVTSVSGTGSVAKTSGESSLTLSTGGTASGATAINQTKAYTRYQPGKSQQIIMTGVLGVQKTNVRSEIGYNDANNGVFFRMDGAAGASVVQRTNVSGSPVDTVIPQASWNIDPLNGTGPSGVTLDFSKTQIFQVDMQWLGVGRVRFGFVVNGVWCLAHQIYNANLITSPYMNSASLPARAMITNTGVADSTTTMKQICIAVASEGGSTTPTAYRFSAANARGGSSISGTSFLPVISIAPHTTFNSLANHSRITVLSVDLLDNSTNGAFWQLIYNTTLTGASFSAFDSTHSGIDVDTTASALSGGIVVAEGFVAGGGHSEVEIDLSDINLPFTLDYTGTVPDIFTLACLSTSGTVSMNGAISWKEER